MAQNGANIAYKSIAMNKEELAQLIDMLIPIERYGQVKHNMEARTERFKLPWNVTLTGYDYDGTDNEASGCTYPIECLTSANWDLSLDKIVKQAFSVMNCPLAKISNSGLVSLATELGEKLNILQRTRTIKALDDVKTTYVPIGTSLQTIEILLQMVDFFKAKGIRPENLNILVGSDVATSLKYNKLTTGVVNIQTLDEVKNSLGVNDIIDDVLLPSKAIYVYVKPYLLIGDMCQDLPFLRDGVNEYEGNTLMFINSIFGASFVLEDDTAITTDLVQYLEIA